MPSRARSRASTRQQDQHKQGHEHEAQQHTTPLRRVSREHGRRARTAHVKAIRDPLANDEGRRGIRRRGQRGGSRQRRNRPEPPTGAAQRDMQVLGGHELRDTQQEFVSRVYHFGRLHHPFLCYHIFCSSTPITLNRTPQCSSSGTTGRARRRHTRAGAADSNADASRSPVGIHDLIRTRFLQNSVVSGGPGPRMLPSVIVRVPRGRKGFGGVPGS